MRQGFTLSEVLITLVVIGIVAALTVPSIFQSVHNQEFKVGYKKAFSDLSRATSRGVAFGEFPYRETKFDFVTTLEEWDILKEQFGVAKVCENNNLYECWADGDRLCAGCSEGSKGQPNANSYGFVDIAGRSWALYYNAENIFLVDINGQKKPNRFGKDRWIFTFADSRGNRIETGFPMKIAPYIDVDYKEKDTAWCQYPPCRYHSWLY